MWSKSGSSNRDIFLSPLSEHWDGSVYRNVHPKAFLAGYHFVGAMGDSDRMGYSNISNIHTWPAHLFDCLWFFFLFSLAFHHILISSFVIFFFPLLPCLSVLPSMMSRLSFSFLSRNVWISDPMCTNFTQNNEFYVPWLMTLWFWFCLCGFLWIRLWYRVKDKSCTSCYL